MSPVEIIAIKPLLVCAGAVVLGATLGALRACWLLMAAEDVDVDINDEPRHLSLLPDLRGTA